MTKKQYNVVKYWNKRLSAEKNVDNKLASSAQLTWRRSQNAKIKSKIRIHTYIYFAFSERPGSHQLKFVQVFSTQPLTNYFTLQRYIALVKPHST